MREQVVLLLSMFPPCKVYRHENDIPYHYHSELCPMVKKVFTYGERKNRTEPVRFGVLPPGPAEPSSELSVALDKEPYDAPKMDRFTKMRLKTQAGRDAAKVIIKGMRGNCTAWNEASTTNNLFRAYVAPDGNVSAFNDVPQGYVDNYLRAQEEIERELPVNTTD